MIEILTKNNAKWQYGKEYNAPTIYEYTIHEIFHHLHPEDKYNIVVYWVDYQNYPVDDKTLPFK